MDDAYTNIAEYNSSKKHKILIVFDNFIPDMLSNKKLDRIVTELFIRGRKLIFLMFLLHILFLFNLFSCIKKY